MTDTPREFQRTHPWISFNFSFRKIETLAWLQLGQIQAKCAQISGVPLLPSVANQLHELYLAKGVLATTAIEGNTLTEEEVLLLLKGELELPPSKEYLSKEIDNIITATRRISSDLVNDAPSELRPDVIKNYNRMILSGLPLKSEVVPGEYRLYNVRVASYLGAPPEDLALLVGRLCDWLNSWPVPNHLKIALGILKAIVAHVYVAWIHPFGDGNGRTARLIELQILLAIGFPTPAVHLLSNHYNQTRLEYYRYLDIASKQEDGIYAFVEYALQGFVDNLDEQIKVIEAQQLIVHWQNHVYALFRNQESKADIRKRRLVLDLSQKTVPLSEVRYVSPRIAEAYAGKSDKMIQRDINSLIEMGLIIKTPKGVQANVEMMRAFLPQKRG
jgi:Fic family protein